MLERAFVRNLESEQIWLVAVKLEAIIEISKVCHGPRADFRQAAINYAARAAYAGIKAILNDITLRVRRWEEYSGKGIARESASRQLKE